MIYTSADSGASRRTLRWVRRVPSSEAKTHHDLHIGGFRCVETHPTTYYRLPAAGRKRNARAGLDPLGLIVALVERRGLVRDLLDVPALLVDPPPGADRFELPAVQGGQPPGAGRHQLHHRLGLGTAIDDRQKQQSAEHHQRHHDRHHRHQHPQASAASASALTAPRRTGGGSGVGSVASSLTGSAAGEASAQAESAIGATRRWEPAAHSSENASATLPKVIVSADRATRCTPERERKTRGWPCSLHTGTNSTTERP